MDNLPKVAKPFRLKFDVVKNVESKLIQGSKLIFIFS